MRHKVLLIYPMMHPSGQRMLEETTDARVVASNDVGVLAPALKEAEAIVVRTPGRVTAEVIGLAPRLRVIGASAAGVDMVDVAAATRAGVPVVHAPGLGAEPVSEHTLGMMLSLAKKITQTDRALREGFTWADRPKLTGTEIAHKTLGIVGLGAIGRELARKAAVGFQMKVVVYDPFVDPGHYPEYEWAATVEDLLPRCDYVSVHAPLTPETHHLINAERLQLMKRTAYLINISRGPLVDQAALIEALKEGVIAGAGIDVYELEPPPADLELFRLPNVVVTPHLGGLSVESLELVCTTTARQVLKVLNGEMPDHCVNREVLAS